MTDQTNQCPRCGARGRTVEALTLEAQVEPTVLGVLDGLDDWRLCTGADCEVVYFCGAETVLLDATRSTPFHKSSAPNRLVCFCFQHSAAEVEEDVRAHGTSTIRESIKAACKAGRDDCKRKNPQGRCCLGNVGQVIKGASAEPVDAPKPGCCDADEEPAEGAGCCAPESATAQPGAVDRAGMFAMGGAMVAAVASSACCWLPLLAIGLGASSAGVGTFFEAWRLPLLGATAGLLGSGFYLTYRKPRCAPGDACAVPSKRLQRVNRMMLWATTLVVALFALFPDYVAALSGNRGSTEATVASDAGEATRYAVEGMTCAGCEGHAKEAIAALPGVESVEVSYEQGSAKVVWDGTPDDEAVSGSLATFGYTAERVR